MKDYTEPYITADRLLEFVSNEGGKSYLTNSSDFLKWEHFQKALAVLKQYSLIEEKVDPYGRRRHYSITGNGITFLNDGGFKIYFEKENIKLTKAKEEEDFSLKMKVLDRIIKEREALPWYKREPMAWVSVGISIVSLLISLYK